MYVHYGYGSLEVSDYGDSMLYVVSMFNVCEKSYNLDFSYGNEFKYVFCIISKYDYVELKSELDV